MVKSILTAFSCIFIFSLQAQTLTESNLPIIVINSALEITGDSKINAGMKVYYNAEGNINRLTDEPTDFDGNISVKHRGQSSQFLYSKKGYSIETLDEFFEEDATKLLDMPKESDWVLHGPYGDKSLMRNALMYTLADDITPYAPRVQMVEVIVNSSYEGVYLFTEKIKRDGDRVDIAKLNDDEITGDDLTGGYILKFDKADDDELGWMSAHSAEGVDPPTFVHVYPDADDIVPEQFDYIKGWMDDFENVLIGSDYTNDETGYRKWINTESFIDFMLLNEMSRNVDGYRLSTYMYKDKDSNDDELYMGPVWDYNLAFGNANYCDGSKIEGWAYDFNDVCPGDFYTVHFWWKRLLTDPTYEADLKDKWERLRNGKFSDANIEALIDDLETQLAEPAQRNFERWDILGEYVWPNEFIGETHQQEVDYLRQWLSDRMAWMDQTLDITLSDKEVLTTDITLSPNPTSNVLKITAGADVQISAVRIIAQNGATVMDIQSETNQINVSNLPAGIYEVQITTNQGLSNERFVKI